MNREIKFRAWDKNNKVMYENAQDAYDFLDGIPATSFGTMLEDEDFVVMQHTGLKDKNGVEIWEGDIYITPFEEKVGKKLGIQIDSKAQVVTWNRCGFSPLENEKYITVIGNIYENPELLTTTK